jgi:glycosyltransferase involved in cell wall biosynthesis
MSKEVLLFEAPVSNRSGYGDHSRDLVRSLIKMDRFDIKIVDRPWGSCPRNALDHKDHDIISRFLNEQLAQQPDVFIQVSVPNEFRPVGKLNIGVTAGMETTIVHQEWIQGCNRMDRIIVPSNHSQKVLLTSQYDQLDQQTNQRVGLLKVEKPIDVLFEGLDTNIFKKISPKEIPQLLNEELSNIKEDFCYLFVGHWLQGALGQDRKDIGGLIKTFIEAFKDTNSKPALILKTSQATFSVIDREQILTKIKTIKSEYSHQDQLPNIYLIHGDLTQEEMNGLYNHPKVKVHVSFTKGEGYGRPLLEASVSAKPVIASNWSGHIDFLSLNSPLLPGGLTQVHPSAAWDKVILKEAQWYTVDYGYAKKLLKDTHKNYKKYLVNAKKQAYFSRTNFNMKDMDIKFKQIISDNIPKSVELKLPKLEGKNGLPKLKLPKLKKV